MDEKAVSAQRIPFRPGLYDLDASGQPYLIGSRCNECNATYFPPRLLCVRCLEDGALSSVRLSPAGVLHTFTIVRQGLPYYETPYLLGYIDLPDGVRVFAQLTECDPEALHIGMPMELVVAPLIVDGDQQKWGYKFRPAAPAAGVKAG